MTGKRGRKPRVPEYLAQLREAQAMGEARAQAIRKKNLANHALRQAERAIAKLHVRNLPPAWQATLERKRAALAQAQRELDAVRASYPSMGKMFP